MEYDPCKQGPPLPKDFTLDIVDVEGKQMDVRVKDSYLNMVADAEEDGVAIRLCSGYRSVSLQDEIYTAKVQRYIDQGYDEQTSEAFAKEYVMQPGLSEHHTGLALDLYTPDQDEQLTESFEDTAAFAWLDAHAADYGFILRYPADKTQITNIEYEPWHYRFVGIEHAKKMREEGLCLEEYLAQFE